jgi:hypothetical protein
MPSAGARARELTVLAATLLAATAILASAALYNGYPLTFWDTRAYLESASTLLPRADRLIGYAFVLRAASVTGSLWPAAIAQCALVAWLVWRVLARLVPQPSAAGYLARVTALAGFTALPWIAGQLMADIFTPVLVLALWLYLEEPSPGPVERAFLLALVAVCVTVHLTHLPLGAALLLLRWPWRRTPSAARLRRRLLAPGLALLVGLAAIGGWSAARTGRFALASGSDAFVLGHLVDSGIASRLLDAHCPERDYWLCPHRARLPMSTDELLWVDALGLQPWEHPAAVSREVSRLLADSLRELPLLHARVALQWTLSTLGRFATGEGLDADALPLIEPRLRAVAPGDVPALIGSRQQRDALPVARLRQLHTPTGFGLLALALCVLAGSALRSGRSSPRTGFIAFAALAWLLNAALSANVSGIYDRYESRLIWLLGLGLSAYWPERARLYGWFERLAARVHAQARDQAGGVQVKEVGRAAQLAVGQLRLDLGGDAARAADHGDRAG